MAVIRDVMPAFDLLQPTTADEAQKLLQQHGHDAWVLAGGLDSFDWLKDRIKKPKVVVDLSGVDELRGIKATSDGGVEIGAMTTLTEVVNNPTIKQKFSLLSQGAERWRPRRRSAIRGRSGATYRRTRAAITIARDGSCYRAGGNICYADTPTGRNPRSTPFLDASRCVAGESVGFRAGALIALDGEVRHQDIQGREKVVDAEDYFIGPDIDITHLNILRPGDLLTAIRIPATWAGAQFFFEKVRDRNVWDFALLNVASAMKVSGGNIENARIAVNGAAARPLRLKSVEDAIKGKPNNAATGEMAGKLAVQGAMPLQFNAYKIPLMRNLVKRSIGGVEVATWAS